MQLIYQTTLFIIISRQKFSVCFTEDVSVMCNLSLGIEERAEARGEARGKARGEAIGMRKTRKEINEKVVKNMYKKRYTIEQISEIIELSEEEVKDIIEDKESM